MDERAANIPPVEEPLALSIIIPTLNEARSIGGTLDAVLKAARGAEVIVVDCGSSDGTTDVARARREGGHVGARARRADARRGLRGAR
jgi:glycosyltransferase involved in cell wall biosynthesis